MTQRIRIETHDGVLGYVWLDHDQIRTVDAAGGDRVAQLVDDMRQTRNGLGMTPQQFMASLPQRLNNGYIWARPETTEQQTTSNGDLRNIFDRDLDAIDPELDRWLTEYWEAREQPPSAGDNQGGTDEAE